MATSTNTKLLAYGGRFLYTVHSRSDRKMFTIKVATSNPEIKKSVALSYSRKVDAIALALALECHKVASGEFPRPEFDMGDIFDLRQVVFAPANITSVVTESVNLVDTFVEKWDSYSLRNFVHENNIGLIECGDNVTNALACCGRYFEAPDDTTEYISKFNEILYRS